MPTEVAEAVDTVGGWGLVVVVVDVVVEVVVVVVVVGGLDPMVR